MEKVREEGVSSQLYPVLVQKNSSSFSCTYEANKCHWQFFIDFIVPTQVSNFFKEPWTLTFKIQMLCTSEIREGGEAR